MGDNLRRLRGMHGLSQEKLCVQLQRMGCDIGRTTYAKYEAGELNIRASVLIALKQIYDCTYDDFFLGLDVVQEKTALQDNRAVFAFIPAFLLKFPTPAGAAAASHRRCALSAWDSGPGVRRSGL